MDGRQRAQQQRLRGTRPIVEELDNLRITFGFDKVQVLTPIVESRLRAGLQPPKALRVAVPLCGVASLEFTFQIGYPSIQASLDLLFEGDNLEEPVREELRQLVANDSTGNITSWVSLVNELKNRLASGGPQDETDMVVPVDGDCTEEEGDEGDEGNEGEEDNGNANQPVAVDANDKGCVEPVAEAVADVHRAVFCCKICGTALFTGSHLHEHSLPGPNRHKCTSYYLEDPPDWLNTTGGDGDKLYCPKCRTRVGAWSWAGSKCSCEAWITPAFQFVKSKLDEKYP